MAINNSALTTANTINQANAGIPSNQFQYYQPTYGSYFQAPQYNQPQQQPVIYQQPVYQQPQQQVVNSSRVWVQGENSAKSYLVDKNNEQVLWDSENPIIYIKTVDAYGRPTMMTLDYTIRQNVTEQNNESNELKKELEDLKNEIRQLRQTNETKTYAPKYNNKKEVATNEH